MYRIMEKGGAEHISDTIVLIRLKNDCYVNATAENAEGFTGKIPSMREEPVRDADGNETGETIEVSTLIDQPFVLPGKTMKGGEPEATYAEEPAVPEIMELESDLEKAYELLYGGDAK